MATRTVSNAGGNFSSTSTWVEGIVPTSVDDVVFTATSGNLTVNVNSECANLDFTNYVNTFSMAVNVNLGVTGNLTLSPSTTYSYGGGTSSIILRQSCNIQSNGSVLTIPLSSTVDNITFTFLDDLTCLSLIFSNSGLGATTTLNGSTVFLNNLTLSSNNMTVGGTTILHFNRSGSSLITTSNVRVIGCNTVLEPLGVLTFSVSAIFSNANLTYVSGTVVWPTTSLIIRGTCVLDLKGQSVLTLLINNNSTNITLNSDINLTNLTCSSSLTLAGIGILTTKNIFLSNLMTLSLAHDLYVEVFQNNGAGNIITVNNYSIYFKTMLINGIFLQGTTQFITDGLTIIEETSTIPPYFIAVPLTFTKGSFVKIKAPRFSYAGPNWLIETFDIEYTKDAILRVGTGTITNAHKLKFKVVNFQSNTTVLSVNEFFQGTALRPCVVNGVTVSNVTSDVVFTDTKKKYTKFTKIKFLDLPTGQLISLTANFKKGNGGRDVDGARVQAFYNGQTANGPALNLDIFDDKTSWPASLLADPTTSIL
jgi:hypothetical protein